MRRQTGVPARLIAALATAACGTGGDVRLLANGNQIGKGRIDHSVPLRFSGYAGMDIGRDNGGVVDRTYADKAPFAFTGTVKKWPSISSPTSAPTTTRRYTSQPTTDT